MRMVLTQKTNMGIQANIQTLQFVQSDKFFSQISLLFPNSDHLNPIPLIELNRPCLLLINYPALPFKFQSKNRLAVNSK